MKRITLWLALALLAAPFAVQAQTIVPFELEIGYRWLDLDGSEDMYRTQIDEQDGFLLRSFTMVTSDFEGATSAFDRFRVDVHEMGAGPDGSLRLEAGKAGRYKALLTYRNSDAFSALPTIANPFLAQGVVPGQHIYDRERRMLDIDVDFLPDAALSPFVGYSWSDNSGPGQTTYQLGQDEFRLAQDLEESEREIRAGLAFRYKSVYGRVTQGWRSFEANETLTLAPGAGAGNNPGSVLGQPVNAGDITRSSEVDVETPFTNIYLTGQVTPRVRLIGTFVHAAADSDGRESESASGQFASFALSRFFEGVSGNIASSANNTTWRGSARADINLWRTVDLTAGYRKEHRELEGSALISTLFIDTMTFGGFDPKDLQDLLAADTWVRRNEEVLDVGVAARAVGPWTLRGGVRQTSRDVTVAPHLSEIVVPGAQGGSFDRRIRAYDLSANFAKNGFLAGAAYERSTANEPVFRTDFLDRDRLRLRAGWRSPQGLLRVGAMAEQINQSNDRPLIDYDSEIRQYTADAEVAPLTFLRLRGAWSKYESDSDAIIRRPSTLVLDRSVHSEKGDSVEAGLTLTHGLFSADGSLTRFENEGSLPFSLDRLRLRLSIDLPRNTGIAAEIHQDQYDESNTAYADFEATRYGLFLRWHP